MGVTSYLVGRRLMRGLVRTRMNVCRKWLLMHAGEKLVLSASKNTTHTMSLPMCRFLCNCSVIGTNRAFLDHPCESYLQKSKMTPVLRL